MNVNSTTHSRAQHRVCLMSKRAKKSHQLACPSQKKTHALSNPNRKKRTPKTSKEDEGKIKFVISFRAESAEEDILMMFWDAMERWLMDEENSFTRIVRWGKAESCSLLTSQANEWKVSTANCFNSLIVSFLSQARACRFALFSDADARQFDREFLFWRS